MAHLFGSQSISTRAVRGRDVVRLSRQASLEFMELIVGAAASDRTAPDALRAMGEEARGRNLAKALHRIADGLTAGKSWKESLAGIAISPGPRFSRVLSAPISEHEFLPLLAELAEIERDIETANRATRAALAYPILLVVLVVTLFLLVELLVLPVIADVASDFEIGTILPTTESFTFDLSRTRRGALLTALATVILAVIGTRFALVTASGSRLLAAMPIFGPIAYFRGVSEMAKLLSVYANRQLPLPVALQTVAHGLPNAELAESCRLLSQRVSEGESLSRAVADSTRLPATLVPFLHWGEIHNQLPEALNTAAKVFDMRSRSRMALLQTVIPPVAFFVVATTAVALISAVVTPLVYMIRSFI